MFLKWIMMNAWGYYNKFNLQVNFNREKVLGKNIENWIPRSLWMNSTAEQIDTLQENQRKIWYICWKKVNLCCDPTLIPSFIHTYTHIQKTESLHFTRSKITFKQRAMGMKAKHGLPCSEFKVRSPPIQKD